MPTHNHLGWLLVCIWHWCPPITTIGGYWFASDTGVHPSQPWVAIGLHLTLVSTNHNQGWVLVWIWHWCSPITTTGGYWFASDTGVHPSQPWVVIGLHVTLVSTRHNQGRLLVSVGQLLAYDLTEVWTFSQQRDDRHENNPTVHLIKAKTCT